MKRYGNIAASVLFLATLIPTSLDAAEGEALSLEERIKRIEEVLGLDGVPGEAVANAPQTGGGAVLRTPTPSVAQNPATALTQVQPPALAQAPCAHARAGLGRTHLEFCEQPPNDSNSQ